MKGKLLSLGFSSMPMSPKNIIHSLLQKRIKAIKDWMDFRSSYGETITEESWLMRDLWQTTNMNYGARRGLATNPKKLQSIAIKGLLNSALWEQGLRQTLPSEKKRHEWKGRHGYRKF